MVRARATARDAVRGGGDAGTNDGAERAGRDDAADVSIGIAGRERADESRAERGVLLHTRLRVRGG